MSSLSESDDGDYQCHVEEEQRAAKRANVGGGSSSASSPPTCGDAMSAAATPPPSAPCMRNGEEVQWSVRFAQGSAFKMFVENIISVLVECTFQVVKTPDFQGLVVESIDATRVCLLQGRLSGQVHTLEPAPQTFCVKMAPMLSFLRSISPSFFVDLWCPKNSTDVVVKLFEPKIGTHAPSCRIRTLAVPQESCQLEGLVFSIFCEIDLQTFRTTIKTAKDHHADSITISVYKPKRYAPAEVGARRLRTHFLVISYSGTDASCEFPYQSTTEISDTDDEDGPQIIKATEAAEREFEALPPKNELDLVYESNFGCESIANFVKTLDRSCLTIRLGSNSPLLLDYPLGSSSCVAAKGVKGGGDYIRFICAPRLTG